jgi:hypothetical protein
MTTSSKIRTTTDGCSTGGISNLLLAGGAAGGLAPRPLPEAAVTVENAAGATLNPPARKLCGGDT